MLRCNRVGRSAQKNWIRLIASKRGDILMTSIFLLAQYSSPYRSDTDINGTKREILSLVKHVVSYVVTISCRMYTTIRTKPQHTWPTGTPFASRPPLLRQAHYTLYISIVNLNICLKTSNTLPDIYKYKAETPLFLTAYLNSMQS